MKINIQYYNKISCYNKIVKYKVTQASERKNVSEIVLAGEETQKTGNFQCRGYVIGGMGVESEFFFFSFNKNLYDLAKTEVKHLRQQIYENEIHFNFPLSLSIL